MRAGSGPCLWSVLNGSPREHAAKCVRHYLNDAPMVISGRRSQPTRFTREFADPRITLEPPPARSVRPDMRLLGVVQART
jgi:hypothetical protein